MKFHIYDFSHMEISPVTFYKCLAEATRLTILLLVEQEGELCVCELTHALQESQPKVSRHLAQLRQCGLLQDRREGQWVYYRLNPVLPAWAMDVVKLTGEQNHPFLATPRHRLAGMGDRPKRIAACCQNGSPD